MAQTLTLPMILPVGTTLYGFCNGYFGRDSYNDKRVEAVGADWVVARDSFTEMPEFANLNLDTVGAACIERWKTKEDL